MWSTNDQQSYCSRSKLCGGTPWLSRHCGAREFLFFFGLQTNAYASLKMSFFVFNDIFSRFVVTPIDWEVWCRGYFMEKILFMRIWWEMKWPFSSSSLGFVALVLIYPLCQYATPRKQFNIIWQFRSCSKCLANRRGINNAVGKNQNSENSPYHVCYFNQS